MRLRLEVLTRELPSVSNYNKYSDYQEADLILRARMIQYVIKEKSTLLASYPVCFNLVEDRAGCVINQELIWRQRTPHPTYARQS